LKGKKEKKGGREGGREGWIAEREKEEDASGCQDN